MPKEFDEIAHSGGTFIFTYHEGNGVSACFRVKSSCPIAAQELCVSGRGEILDYVSPSGIGEIIPYPQPSILCFLLSDKEGFFGAMCPQCESYFRVSYMPIYAICPYCGIQDKGVRFLTNNQKAFINVYCQTFIHAFINKVSVEVDIETLVKDLQNNTQGWIYNETRQQSQHTCSKCGSGRSKYDILGDYGVCPFCGTPNYASVIHPRLNALEAKNKSACMEQKTIESTDLSYCFTEFEALGNALRRQLILIPATHSRKEKLSGINFQQLERTADCLMQWLGIDIFRKIKKDDMDFLKLMLNRRHVFTHNAGGADQKYLDNTSDSTVKLNQVLRLQNTDIVKLVPILRMCVNNLISDFSEIIE